MRLRSTAKVEFSKKIENNRVRKEFQYYEDQQFLKYIFNRNKTN